MITNAQETAYGARTAAAPQQAAGAAPAVEVNDLRKSYGNVQAVRGLSFTVPAGSIFGFLGHNGAGKTTTIKILTTVMPADGGSARVLGYDIVRDADEIKKRIGVVYEEQNLYERVSARDNLELTASLYGVPNAGKRINEVLEMVSLEKRGNDKVSGFSNGMKQRLLIARALVHKPALLFLDEPTKGLDPVAALELREVIHSLRRQGMTIMLTSHQMEEVDRLCDRLAFISEGRLVVEDTPRNLKLRYGKRLARVLLEGSDDEIAVDMDNPAEVARLTTWLTETRVRSLHSEEATLEEVFLQLAGRPLE